MEVGVEPRFQSVGLKHKNGCLNVTLLTDESNTSTPKIKRNLNERPGQAPPLVF